MRTAADSDYMPAPCAEWREAMRRAETCAPGRPDTVGHSSIQAWSAGELFPAVIARVETYRPAAYHELAAGGALDTLAARLVSTHWDLTLDGVTRRFATRDDAEAVARSLLEDPLDRFGHRHLWACGYLYRASVERPCDHYGVL